MHTLEYELRLIEEELRDVNYDIDYQGEAPDLIIRRKDLLERLGTFTSLIRKRKIKNILKYLDE